MKSGLSRVISVCMISLVAVDAAVAESLPSADAPVFLDVARNGHAAATIVLPDSPSETERIAADKLKAWCANYAGVDVPLKSRSAIGSVPEGNFILLGTHENQTLIAELVKDGNGGPADLPFLSEEGFGLETLERGKAKYLVIAGRTAKGVFHGAVYVRDFLLDILPPDKGVVVREVKLVRSSALPVRGPYLLPQYGTTPLMTLAQWKHIVDVMAEGGINQIHWWVAGMYASKRYPESFEIKQTKMSVADLRELCRFAQARGIKFLVGGGAFSWHGASGLFKNRPELSPASGICPSLPESQKLMADYVLDWVETFPEADGIWLEPRDESGICRCDLCFKKLDAFNSRQYGQSEIAFLKMVMKKVWARNPKLKLVWLVEFLKGNTNTPHYDDPLYFERIREIKDPRIEWQVVWIQRELPGPRNEPKPIAFFSRNCQFWDKPYWPHLDHRLAHARMAAEQGYVGYSNAWEPGFDSCDWYGDEVPYPVDIIPETLTHFGFREACWEPGQTWDEFVDRVHRRYFSREMPRSLAQDMLYLRQYITMANYEFRSPMEFSEEKPLSAEVDRIKQLDDPAQQVSAAKRLSAILDVLKKTRDEDLPRMVTIEAKLRELEPKASLKSKAAIELIRRAIADSRRVYQRAVPDDAILDQAIAAVQELGSTSP